MTGLLFLPGCRTFAPEVPDRRPGDFRLGVVVMAPESSSDLAGGDARYIIESDSILRASFGAGSTLDTYPGFTRRLTPEEMDAIWIMTSDLLESNESQRTLSAGQPQSMVKAQRGTIIEIHHNAHDEVWIFDSDDQQAAAIVDALASLAWIDDPNAP